MYSKLKEAEHLRFSTCQGCTKSCCDGSQFILTPLVLDDFKEVYERFVIAFAFIAGKMRVVMLLSNRIKPCIYYKEGLCSIYNMRPPGCKIYPYTPFHDEILIDKQCEAVGAVGLPLAEELRVHNQFYHERFENFSKKLEQTDSFLERVQDDMRPLFEIEGVMLLEYIGAQQNSFIRMHKASLRQMVHWR